VGFAESLQCRAGIYPFGAEKQLTWLRESIKNDDEKREIK